MDNKITYENLRSFAYTNADLISGNVKGILLYFKGLNFNSMIDEHFEAAKEDAKNGIIYVLPYYDPWCWMNERTVQFVDNIVDVVKQHFKLDKVKIAVSGQSMGGMGSLIYCIRSKYKSSIVSCTANCPVCDTVFHATERKDLPRTFLAAYGTLDADVLKKHSPLHCVSEMPNIEYNIFHSTGDKQVMKAMNSDRLVEKLKRDNKKVNYVEVYDREHCDLGEYRDAFEKASRECLR